MKRAGLRLLAVVAGLLVAVFAGEATLRITLPPVDLHTMTGKRAGTHPMADWARVDAFCAYRGIPGEYLGLGEKSINRDGFISTPDLEVEKEPGTWRVVFLGGSSTACTSPNLGDEHAWPTVAAARLRAAHPGRRIEFINAAMPGYSTFESYARLWSRVRFYTPDFVVVYHGWNDMGYFLRPDRQHLRHVPEDGGWSFERPYIRQRIKRYPADRWFEWSHLYCRLRRAFGEPLRGEVGPAKGGALRDDYDPRGPELFRQNVRLMVRAQEPLGFKLFVVKQATLIREGVPKATRDRCMVHFHGFSFDAHLRAFEDVYRVIDEVVPGSQILDATEFSGNRDVLADHVHLTKDGARRLGESIADQLTARLAPTEAAAK